MNNNMLVKEYFGEGNVIEFKNKKWKIVSRSKVVDSEDRNKVIDYFIVALCKSQVLSFLESNIATYHIDNWNNFHNRKRK